MKIEFLPFERRDLSLYLAWRNQPAVCWADSVAPYRPITAEGSANHLIKNRYAFKLRVDQVDVGYLGLIDYRPGDDQAEFFIVIGEVAQWGKGIGRAAMQQLIAYAKTELGLKKLRGRVLGHNRRALALYQRVGFRIVGHHPPCFRRDNQVYDIVRIELDLVNYSATLPES